MERYLITGSSGFIGVRLLNSLKHTECYIRLLARRIDSNYETIICDLGKDKIPKPALNSVSTIIHLAGIAHDIQNKYTNEKTYNIVNVDATIELANLAVMMDVKKFIYISSVKAGGSSINGKCVNETDQNDIIDIYGKTKKEAEIKLLEIGRKSNMHISIIRPSLVYGPGVKGNLQLMLSLIKKGWFPPLPEIHNKRSMIHVDDLVQAILLVSEEDRANGEIYIATDGVPHSSRDIYIAMCSIVGRPVPKWNVPMFVFSLASLISPSIRLKLDKLLGDECYSSSKLESLGFNPKRELKEMNETSF